MSAIENVRACSGAFAEVFVRNVRRGESPLVLILFLILLPFMLLWALFEDAKEALWEREQRKLSARREANS